MSTLETLEHYGIQFYDNDNKPVSMKHFIKNIRHVWHEYASKDNLTYDVFRNNMYDAFGLEVK